MGDGDQVYGIDPGLRAECEAQQIGYVLAIGCDRRVPTAAGPMRADALVAGLPRRAWQQLCADPGAKGERHYDWRHMCRRSSRDHRGAD